MSTKTWRDYDAPGETMAALRQRGERGDFTTEVLARRQWGAWTLDTVNLTLTCHMTGKRTINYEIDLEKIRNPAQLWGWVSHIKHKGGVWDETDVPKNLLIGDLVAALDDIYGLDHMSASAKSNVSKYLRNRYPHPVSANNPL